MKHDQAEQKTGPRGHWSPQRSERRSGDSRRKLRGAGRTDGLGQHFEGRHDPASRSVILGLPRHCRQSVRGPRFHNRNPRRGDRCVDGARRHAAGNGRYRGPRILGAVEGLAQQANARDRNRQNQELGQSHPSVSRRQELRWIGRVAPRHSALRGAVYRWSRFRCVRKRSDGLRNDCSHNLQRRYAGHSPRPDRSRDRQLG